MATRLLREGVGNFKEFGQSTGRLEADKQLKDMIIAKRIWHDGNQELRQHIDNANMKRQSTGIRLEKRHQSKKIDAAVALSMAVSRCLYYNL